MNDMFFQVLAEGLQKLTSDMLELMGCFPETAQHITINAEGTITYETNKHRSEYYVFYPGAFVDQMGVDMSLDLKKEILRKVLATAKSKRFSVHEHLTVDATGVERIKMSYNPNQSEFVLTK